MDINDHQSSKKYIYIIQQWSDYYLIKDVFLLKKIKYFSEYSLIVEFFSIYTVSIVTQMLYTVLG